MLLSFKIVKVINKIEIINCFREDLLHTYVGILNKKNTILERYGLEQKIKDGQS